jgi:hypothetical protein
VQRFHVRNLQGTSIEMADAAQDPDLPPSLLIRRAAIMEILWQQLDPADSAAGQRWCTASNTTTGWMCSWPTVRTGTVTR